jgi:hypothetical protein
VLSDIFLRVLRAARRQQHSGNERDATRKRTNDTDKKTDKRCGINHTRTRLQQRGGAEAQKTEQNKTYKPNRVARLRTARTARGAFRHVISSGRTALNEFDGRINE